MTQNTTLDLLLTRRSVVAKDLREPGPSPEQLELILQAAHRVPDHGKIGPWRFIVFEGESRETFGEKIAKIFQKNQPDASDKLIEFERTRLMRAPCVIAVVANIDEQHPKIPIWEQQLAVGACCQNLLVAANSFGFGAQWLTEWYSYDEEVNAELELKNSERIAGFIYLGTYEQKPAERNRPDLQERIQKY
jgi:nitroreductase